MTEGPRFQVEPAQTDDSSRDTYVVFDPSSGNLAIDYSQYYERIASSVEQMSTDIKRLRNLGDSPSGPGIRTTQPYGYIGTVLLYQLYIVQARILADFNEEATPERQQESLEKFNELFNELIQKFDSTAGGFN